MKATLWMIAVVTGLGLLLSGCANEALHSRGVPTALAESLTADQGGEAEVRPERMLIWRGYLTLEVWEVEESMRRAVALAEQFNGYVEHKADSGGGSASVRLRIPVAAFKDAVGELEQLGRVTDRTVSGEDVTEQYIDIEARLKNKIELRDRLRQLLEKAAEVKDILAIETELNRVQADIDAMEGKIRLLKGQVDYATIEVTLQRQKILGPVGYVLKGLWWGIEKLFVLRD